MKYKSYLIHILYLCNTKLVSFNPRRCTCYISTTYFMSTLDSASFYPQKNPIITRRVIKHMSWNNNAYAGILRPAGGSQCSNHDGFPRRLHRQVWHVFCSKGLSADRLIDGSPSQQALSSRSGRKPFLQLQLAPASKFTQAEFSVQVFSSAQKS